MIRLGKIPLVNTTHTCTQESADSIELQYVSIVMTTAAWERIPTELLRRYWNDTVIGHIHDDVLDLAPISSPLAVWNNDVVTVRRLFWCSHTKNSCSLTYSSNKQPTLDCLIYRGSIPLICIHTLNKDCHTNTLSLSLTVYKLCTIPFLREHFYLQSIQYIITTTYTWKSMGKGSVEGLKAVVALMERASDL